MVCGTVWRAKDKEVQDTPMPALMPGVEIILDIVLQKSVFHDFTKSKYDERTSSYYQGNWLIILIFLQEPLLYRTFEAVITQDFKPSMLKMHTRLRITKGRLFWQFFKIIVQWVYTVEWPKDHREIIAEREQRWVCLISSKVRNNWETSVAVRLSFETA